MAKKGGGAWDNYLSEGDDVKFVKERTVAESSLKFKSGTHGKLIRIKGFAVRWYLIKISGKEFWFVGSAGIEKR